MVEERKEEIKKIKKEADEKEVKKEAEKKRIDKKSTKLPDIKVWNVLQYSLLTEKSISLVESQNKLVFVVRRTVNKNNIKWAIEKEFDVKIDSVRTLIDRKGRKKVFVKLNKDFNAGEIATRLGML